MKLLLLSDLHIQADNDRVVLQIKKIKETYDAVIISGDIFEYNYNYDRHAFLNKLFKGKPVICTLGNHEFFHSSFQETLDFYSNNYNPDIHNVHYLDTMPSYILGDCEFIGGFLGYDGSLQDISYQVLTDWADNCWADRYILNWVADYKKANQYYCDKIVKAYNNSKSLYKILVTHTVPHKELNLHSKSQSRFNAYSGVDDFLKFFKFDYAICGHTHRRTVGKNIHGTLCCNVGSDYDELKYMILEI